MPPPVPEHAVVGLLRQCFITPKCQALTSTYRAQARPAHRKISRTHISVTRSLTTRTVGLQNHARPIRQRDGMKPLLRSSSQAVNLAQGGKYDRERIAVVGGGITGLASAHYLAREKPNAIITLYEGSSRLGGWLQSKEVEVEKGTIVFEGGPRTLRSNSAAGVLTLELITQLGLQDQILTTLKDSLSAQNRFIYYPDHLVRMPGPGQDLYSMAWGVLTEPVFKGFVPGVLGEWSRGARPPYLEDESIGDFLKRRLGRSDVGDNIVSAVLHGIYAGDINQLSVKSLMPKLWFYENCHGNDGSMTQTAAEAMFRKSAWIPYKDIELGNELTYKIDPHLADSLSHASVYTFKGGIGALSTALEKGLRTKPNVHFKMNEKIAKIDYDGETDKVKITNSNSMPSSSYDTVISTLSGKHLSSLTSEKLPSLASQHSVTVMVVNLYYPDPDLLPERGFGYLIPRSIPYEQNPECALGVVFDSDSSVGQDTATGTKVTVMIGGHWWDGFDTYPDEEEGVAMAKAVLKRHLHVDAEPEVYNVGLHKECIPQYVVGHDAALKAAHYELLDAFKGKLKVAGNSYKGVGLNDCVRSARDVVLDLDNGKSETGLDEFTQSRTWAQAQMRRSE